jgi:hypothetical protein
LGQLDTVTAIIPHYRRGENIPDVVRGLRNQSVQTEIWLVSNAGRVPVDIAEMVDVTIESSRNFGCSVRFPIMGLVRSRWIWTQDDDWKITDGELFRSLIDWYGSDIGRLSHWLTRGGKILATGGRYVRSGGNVEEGPAPACNTGYSFFPTALVAQFLPLNAMHCARSLQSEKEMRYADDIWVSAHIRGYVHPAIVAGVQPMPEKKDGLCFHADHYPVRDAACRRLLL